MTRWLFAVSIAALLGAACGSSMSMSPTGPGVGVQALQGTWGSTAVTTAQNTCTNYKWTVTSITGNSGSGNFSATCLGTIDVAGTATGTLSGTTLTWSATGAATTLVGGVSCPFSLSGTATLENSSQIRVPYTGSTCMGPVSGTEVLKK